MINNNISKSSASLVRFGSNESEKSSQDFERGFDPDRTCTRMALTDLQKKVKCVPSGLCSFPCDLDRNRVPFAARRRSTIKCGSERKGEGLKRARLEDRALGVFVLYPSRGGRP
jgi:hypothetical protein